MLDIILAFVLQARAGNALDGGTVYPASYNPNIYTHSGSDYYNQIRNAVLSEFAFKTFKSKRWSVIWKTYFHYWHHFPVGETAISYLGKRAPHLLRMLPQLAEIDRRVGRPVEYQYDFPHIASLRDPDFPPLVRSSPVVPRYLFELSMLERMWPSGFRGWRITEIGGGYGMMAIAFWMAHQLKQYTVIDLDVVGELIQKHARRTNASHVPRTQIVDDGPVASDLLISFFCISEQTRGTVQTFVEQYVAHADKGYFQLNYDEDLAAGGASYDPAENKDRYNAFELFRLVYRVQPSALLLPPISDAVYSGGDGHHRIVWGLNSQSEW